MLLVSSLNAQVDLGFSEVARLSPEYTVVPLGLEKPFQLIATIENSGADAATGIVVTAVIKDLDNPLNPTFTFSSTAFNLAAQSDMEIDFSPTAEIIDLVGTWQAEFTLTLNEVDANPDDNIALSESYEISKGTYARDDPEAAFGGNFSPSNTGSGNEFLGQVFELKSTTTFIGIEATLRNFSGSSSNIQGVMWSCDSNGKPTGNFPIKTSAAKNIPSDGEAHSIILPFTIPANVGPGKYLFGTKHIDPNIGVRSVQSIYSDTPGDDAGNFWVRSDVDTEGLWEKVNPEVAFEIRALTENYDCTLGDIAVMDPHIGLCNSQTAELITSVPPDTDLTGDGKIRLAWLGTPGANASGGSFPNPFVTQVISPSYIVDNMVPTLPNKLKGEWLFQGIFHYNTLAPTTSVCGTTAAQTVIFSDGFTLTADITDSNGADNGSINLITDGGYPPFTYDWVSGQSTAEITNLAPGDYFVTVRDGGNCQEIKSFTVDLETSVDEQLIGQIAIFPNPVSDQVQLQIPTGLRFAQAKIYDLNGKVVRIAEQATFTVDGLMAGYYVVEVEMENGKMVRIAMIKA